MKTIEFFPAEFHNVNLGFREMDMNPCSPGYPNELFPTNKIEINVPQKVVYRLNLADSVIPILPVCVLKVISEKRVFKYDHLSAELIHVSKIGNDRTTCVAELYDNDPNIQYEHPALDPFAHEQKEERSKLIAEAQEYSDNELEEGLDWGRFMNIDALEYVDIPIETGTYEVWMSLYGLESNHCFVDVVVE